MFGDKILDGCFSYRLLIQFSIKISFEDELERNIHIRNPSHDKMDFTEMFLDINWMENEKSHRFVYSSSSYSLNPQLSNSILLQEQRQKEEAGTVIYIDPFTLFVYFEPERIKGKLEFGGI